MVEQAWAMRPLDGGRRLTIPASLAGTLPWLVGGAALNGWLLAIHSERHRLLSDEEAARSEVVRSLLRLKEGSILETTDPAEYQTPPLAVAGSRLVSIAVHPPPPGWRLSLAGLPSTPSFNTTTGPVMLVSSEGHLEIWSLRLFQEARDTPLGDVLALIS
jgi:hypothetical protein